MFAPACWGNTHLSYHMHYQTKAKNLKFGSVTFSLGVYAYTHYYGCVCMAKGKPSHRSLGVKHKVELELPKVPAPVVKLD